MESAISRVQRTSRQKRNRHRIVKLVSRDLDILLALAKMRLARTSDLARLFFGAIGTAQKRLRRLFDLGLVRAVVTDLAAENRYAITKIGHRFLEEARPGEIPVWRPTPRTDGRSLAHLDLLNRYRVALALGAQALGVNLARFVPEWELRSIDPMARIIPDAALLLEVHGRWVEIALEVDTGTEPSSTLKKKVRAYNEARDAGMSVSGMHAPELLFLARSTRRAHAIARAISDDFPTAWVGHETSVRSDGGLVVGVSRAGDLSRAGRGEAAFGGGLLRGGDRTGSARHVREPV